MCRRTADAGSPRRRHAGGPARHRRRRPQLTGADLAGYQDPYSFLADDETPRPLGAVQPATVEEVQSVVRLAAETGVQLWTVSRGRNYRAGHAPYRAHTAFMDLMSSQYNAGDSALRHTVEKIKDALDPRGVLSPWKQGNWPGGSPTCLT